MADRKLTDKQKLFAKEYLKDLNATQAAIRAGYSEKTAEVIGHENLRKPNLAKYIQKQMDKRSQKLEITAEDVLQSILDIRADAMQKTVKIEYNKYSEGNEYITYHEEMVDRPGALKANELLGKHLKLFTDKVELEVTKMPTIKFGK